MAVRRTPPQLNNEHQRVVLSGRRSELLRRVVVCDERDLRWVHESAAGVVDLESHEVGAVHGSHRLQRAPGTFRVHRHLELIARTHHDSCHGRGTLALSTTKLREPWRPTARLARRMFERAGSRTDVASHAYVLSHGAVLAVAGQLLTLQPSGRCDVPENSGAGNPGTPRASPERIRASQGVFGNPAPHVL